jgi:hydrogenase assembly chaperone HypC/HupF
MCLTIPGRVMQRDGPLALVERDGQLTWCNALAQPDVRVGDYVATHADLIIAILSAAEAHEILSAAEEWELLLAAEETKGTDR